MTYPTPIDPTWKLIFDDEFGGSVVDASKWTPNWLGSPGEITKPINSAELAAFDPVQATVHDGALHLAAVKRSVKASNGVTYAFASGCVTSNGKFNKGPPLFLEALITLPGSAGKIYNWPAYWINGQHWPNDGEVDIMEGLGGNLAVHMHYSGGGPGFTVPGDFTGTHHYAVLWVGSTAEYYCDGKKVWSTGNVPSAAKYMIFDYAISPPGQWGGAQVVPNEMQIHYARAYSNAAGTVAIPPQPGYVGPGDGLTPPLTLEQRVTALETRMTSLEGRVATLEAKVP